MHSVEWKTGDWVVYVKQKTSTSPGPRAKRVSPAPAGDTYSYLVDKYWVVSALMPDKKLCLKTRRGKQHIVASDDPRLRKARLWERCLLASRFRAVEHGQPSGATGSSKASLT